MAALERELLVEHHHVSAQEPTVNDMEIAFLQNWATHFEWLVQKRMFNLIAGACVFVATVSLTVVIMKWPGSGWMWLNLALLLVANMVAVFLYFAEWHGTSMDLATARRNRDAKVHELGVDPEHLT